MQRLVREVSTSNFKKFQDLELLRLESIQEQRRHLLKMWKNQEITDRQLNRLEQELDLEETQWTRAELK